MKIDKKILISSLFIIFIVSFYNIGIKTNNNNLFIKQVFAEEITDIDNSSGGLYDPLSGVERKTSSTEIENLIGKILNGLMGLVGAMSLMMFVWGGFLWISSGGRDTKIKQGKDTIIWAIWAIVAIFIASAGLKWIFNALAGS